LAENIVQFGFKQLLVLQKIDHNISILEKCQNEYLRQKLAKIAGT
jgi:hypothetical protein